jgi:serine/threonine protein kinase
MSLNPKLKANPVGNATVERLKITSPSGKPALLKIIKGAGSKKGRAPTTSIAREKTALRLLQDLAVPKLVHIDPKQLGNSIPISSYVAVEWLSWNNARERDFNFVQACGVWLFVLEQLCAFRRQGVLYTDMKPDHVLLNANLSKCVIIDFDGATASNDQGIYNASLIVVTLPWLAPETPFKKILTESAAVYSMVLLLASFLKKGTNNYELDDKPWQKAKQQLKAKGQGKLVKLLNQGLSHSPKERPATYEKLLQGAQKSIASPAAFLVWEKLRKPYRAQLHELGLEGPTNK